MVGVAQAQELLHDPAIDIFISMSFLLESSILEVSYTWNEALHYYGLNTGLAQKAD